MEKVKLILILLLVLLLCGCSVSTIREDGIREDLPGIDPNAGVGRDINITLYYRLSGEPALVPVQRTITVRSNEYAEAAVIRRLLEGPSSLSWDLISAFPKDVRLVDISKDGKILYVTFSREILDADTSGERADAEESYRLCVYSIVNTLTALDSNTRVQIMVDLDGTGEGSRVAASLLGFSSHNSNSQWLEPLSFQEDVLVTPAKVAEYILEHLKNEEYAEAHSLFAESETGGLQKPDYAAFETQMLSLGKVTDYRIIKEEIAEDNRSAVVTLDVSWTSRDNGQSNAVKNVRVRMLQEGELKKMGWNSFLTALQNNE
ncbi:MAG: GerMN domain-containing protein [Eubacteriales bacterium]|nr:GerMN domain-containing protein [Eubacteriales bacterium]